MGESGSGVKEPYFYLSVNRALEQLKVVSEVSDIVSYSFKTNPIIGEVLRDRSDVLFSVHSDRVLDRLPGDRIIYFAQGWSPDELIGLMIKGIFRFVVDNPYDLKVFTDVVSRSDLQVRLGFKPKLTLFLRMRLRERTVHTGKYFVYGFYSHEVNDLVSKVRSLPYVEHVGIHFHRKTQNLGEWYLVDEVSEGLTEDTLSQVDFIDVGGGIPSLYKNYRVEMISLVLKRIKEFKLWVNKQGIRTIVEPGRFIAAPSIKLYTYVKSVYNGNVIVNSSVYNTSPDIILFNHRPLVLGEYDEDRDVFIGDDPQKVKGSLPVLHRYVIKGETPDSFDIFRYKVLLPRTLTRGDELVFLNMGAYNFHTDFCNLPRIRTVIGE